MELRDLPSTGSNLVDPPRVLRYGRKAATRTPTLPPPPLPASSRVLGVGAPSPEVVILRNETSYRRKEREERVERSCDESLTTLTKNSNDSKSTQWERHDVLWCLLVSARGSVMLFLLQVDAGYVARGLPA